MAKEPRFCFAMERQAQPAEGKSWGRSHCAETAPAGRSPFREGRDAALMRVGEWARISAKKGYLCDRAVEEPCNILVPKLAPNTLPQGIAPQR